MVQLKPTSNSHYTCPECLTECTIVNEIRFETIHVLADCTCTCCGLEFFQVLPVGHTVAYPMSLGKINGTFYQQDKTPAWLASSFLKAHENIRKDEVPIEIIIYNEYDRVIILNTLDTLYGHVLLKLYNAFHHLDHQKDIGLVIIIPKIFKWLIPPGCAEVWVVDLNLDELVYSYEAIQKFVNKQSHRFQEIYLSYAYSHPDFSTVDISRLTEVTPFPLESFSAQSPTITFVLREDRWWYPSTADYWFYRMCRKLKVLQKGAKYLSSRQNSLIKKTITLIRKKLPNASFHIVGLGGTGTFVGYASDERKWKLNPIIERAWCNTYARSHVVIGIHGSNMLLPTAFAAGCVEILPEDRYGNMVQDLSVRYNNRLQLFFYRFVDQFAHPKSVASKAVGIITDFELYNRNMCRHTHRATRDHVVKT
jgi:hypothetical protein